MTDELDRPSRERFHPSSDVDSNRVMSMDRAICKEVFLDSVDSAAKAVKNILMDYTADEVATYITLLAGMSLNQGSLMAFIEKRNKWNEARSKKS